MWDILNGLYPTEGEPVYVSIGAAEDRPVGEIAETLGSGASPVLILSYLSVHHYRYITYLLSSILILFSDALSGTHMSQHDADVGSASPVEQHAWRRCDE